ncbi:MAG: exodeoxyribonuclease V subunit gamma [Bacteroidota bacterium]
MALQLKVSNSLDQLAAALCNDLQQQQLDPFQPVYIITQTDGMTTWLKYKIAGEIGIAANYRYLKSQDIIGQVFYLLGGKSGELLSTQNLSWVLYKLLGEDEFIRRYKNVSGYYSGPGGEDDIKRMSLAGKTADLFDQYQIYRPEMIQEWNQATKAADQKDWQKYLWQKAKELLGSRLPDKTNISSHITRELTNSDQQQHLREKMPVIYLFGLSITTNYHLEVYHAIGQLVNVGFYLINPAPGQYWFEDIHEKQLSVLIRKGYIDAGERQTGNALLTSWGKVLQDTYSILFQDDELINAYDDVGIVTPTANNLLKKIQADIFVNNPGVSQFDEADCNDGSIVINSCYSPAREVEVLYNWLVSINQTSAITLSPRDIVVMVSDIDQYTPYIKAVFDNAPYKFRYSITDENFTSGDTITAALKSLLLVSEENFTSENVLQLLDSSYIKKRFSVTDIPLIRDAINKANIRFGIANENADDTQYVSWKYGLQRIMFGICMSGDEEYGEGPESFYPLDLVEGLQANQLIRFTHFVEVLISTIQERNSNRTITQWVEYVQRVLDNLVCEPELFTEEDYLLLIKQLGTYNVLNELFEEEVSFRVFLHSFLQTLETGTAQGSFVSSGITFCSLIPMRSIPFKVVAMLGLNFDKFPRKDAPLSFNLMEQKKRKGDRNVKENDKHLFLETLLSAQEFLYLSYVGQNAKDNSGIPPSALIDELVDYIQAGLGDGGSVRKLLVTRHPLHGFSRLYNQPGNKLVTYLNAGDAKPTEIIDPEKLREANSFDEIALDGCINFFKNPFKGYYNNVLKIYYREDDVLLEEEEVFELDHLQQWQLKNELLVLDEEPALELKDKLVKTGRLPLRHMADVAIATVNTAVMRPRELLQSIVHNENATSLPIEIKLAGSTLKGTIKNIYGDRLLAISFSGNECKYLLEAYIRYLSLRAAGYGHRLFYISAKKDEIYPAVEISTAEAKETLEALLNLYKEGHENILSFYPSFKQMPDDLDDVDLAGFQKMVDKELNNYKMPSNDPYILKEFGSGYFEELDILDRYKSSCELLLKPLARIFPGFYDK